MTWRVVGVRAARPQVADMRITYTRGGLEDEDMRAYLDDPMRAFGEWFQQAVEGKASRPAAPYLLGGGGPTGLQRGKAGRPAPLCMRGPRARRAYRVTSAAAKASFPRMSARGAKGTFSGMVGACVPCLLAALPSGQVCEEPNAISLASVDPSTGQPSVRVVLLKGFDERGFIFYTNFNRCALVCAHAGPSRGSGQDASRLWSCI